MKKVLVVTLDEEFEKARTKGAKDTKKRKHRLSKYPDLAQKRFTLKLLRDKDKEQKGRGESEEFIRETMKY